MVDKKDVKSVKDVRKYQCDKCNFSCRIKYNYMKHLDTRKHRILTDIDGLLTKKMSFECDCGKEYKFRQSLHAHKKKCSQLKEDNTRDKPEPQQLPQNEIVAVLLEQNTMYQEQNTMFQEQNTMFQELIMKNEEEKKEFMRKTEEEKKEFMRKTEEQQRKTEEEKNELLRRNEEQQAQMMELHEKFLEALNKSQ